MVGCYLVLHEFLVSTYPSAGSPLLTEVGNKFASVGLCEQAEPRMDLPTVERVPCWLYYTSHIKTKEDTVTESQLHTKRRQNPWAKLILVGCLLLAVTRGSYSNFHDLP